jgi:hypothetical protein
VVLPALTAEDAEPAPKPLLQQLGKLFITNTSSYLNRECKLAFEAAIDAVCGAAAAEQFPTIFTNQLAGALPSFTLSDRPF